MSWVSIDDGAPDHRKQLAAGPAACWLWVCGLCYCNRQKARDGFIPDEKVPVLYPIPNAKREADKLVSVGLWERVEGGYQIHDFHDFQLDAKQVAARREARAQAGKRGGKASAVSRKGKQTPEANEANGKQVLHEIEATGEANGEANTKQVLGESFTKTGEANEANVNPLPIPSPPLASKKQDEDPHGQLRKPNPADPKHPVSELLTANAWMVHPEDPLVVAAGLISIAKIARRSDDELLEATEHGLQVLGRKYSGGGVEDGSRYLAAVVGPLLRKGGLEAEREALQRFPEVGMIAEDDEVAARAAAARERLERRRAS